MKFNCAQRAHQNTLEAVPHTLFTILFSGLRYPTLAIALGSIWVFGRTIYTLGYSTGEPAKVCSVPSTYQPVGLTTLRQRNRGGFHAIGLLGQWPSTFHLIVYLMNYDARSVRLDHLCCV